MKDLKKCTKCKKFLARTEFHKSKDRADGLSYRCKDCARQHAKENWSRTVTKKALRDKKKRYGISEAEYIKMSKNGCEVCGSFERLAVDHDHSCCEGQFTCGSCVRGMLCIKCNTAEGMLDGSVEKAIKLAKYMEKYSK